MDAAAMLAKRRQTGFTIYELMLTVAVAAIILGVAIPNLRDYGRNNRMTASANDLVVAITSARSQAIRTRIQTIMCLTQDPNATVPTCNGNGTQGWVVYSDTNANGTAESGEPVVLRHGPLDASLSVRTKPDTNGRYVAFNPTGFARILSGSTPLSGLVICDSRGNQALYGNDSTARGIQISTMGRPRVTRDRSTINGAALGGCP
jgi:type IV fimbrial biogenesis protein FimT